MNTIVRDPKPDSPLASQDAGLDLATKYACNGPRYTSYPTAPQFSTDFPVDEYTHWQANKSNERSAPLSLYIHLPFCRDICYYCACNKIVTRKAGVTRTYLDHLQTEIVRQSSLVGAQRPITQMHWGGGTPTYLDGAEITELMHMLASHFNLLDKGYREYSIEIDPRTVDSATIALLKGVGFNRVSLGIQDFDPLVQRATNRIQPYKQISNLVENIRGHDFRSLSFDLIYGLPHQDTTSMAETLAKVVKLRPDRIACYSYAHMPERFSSQRSIDRLALPGPEEKLRLQLLIAQTLQDQGYLHIGMDHYVLPEDDLARAQSEGRLQRNFQGYSLQMADDTLGLGVSAISHIGDYYLQNERALNRYYQRLEEGDIAIARGCKMTAEDKIRRQIIMQLISDLKLDIAECEDQFGINFIEKFRWQMDQLSAMELDGLVEISASEIQVTPKGRPFLRNICMPFDAYLNKGKGDPGAPQFSATL